MTATPLSLEGPDDRITAIRAAQLSGLTQRTVLNLVANGRLRSVLADPRHRYTTRRWLHAYLMSRSALRGQLRTYPESRIMVK